VIDGGADADTITGGGGSDTITGGTGNDTIYVDSGTDTLTDFTIGSDKLTINSGAIAYVYASGVANYSNDVTNSGNLYIDGSQTYTGILLTSAENITGSSGAESIKGGAGNDTITGGLGIDSISAGAGIDTITDFKVGEDTLTILSGATAKVSFIGGTTVTYNAVNNLGILNISIAAGTTTVTGSAGADSITGSAGTDSIDGGAGNDTIIGGLSNDTITGGSGSDTITVDAGTDTITDFTVGEDTLSIIAGAIAHVYTSGSNRYVAVTNNGTLFIDGIDAGGTQSITGSTGTDSIVGGGFNDTITGGDGNDTITGGLGSDSITVGAGIDTITDFKVGEDTLTILSGATAHVYASTAITGTAQSLTYAYTNAGTLYIDGATTFAGLTVTGAESITGSVGADSIVGGAGSDSIVGGDGNDTISGGYGDDSITGGAGNDIISGGSGRNTITVDSGTDTITDFLLSYDTLNVSLYATARLYAFTITSGGNVNYSNISNSGTLYIDGSTTYAGTQITGVENIIGSTGADFIVGGRGNDTIKGADGNDTITSGAGNDLIVVSPRDPTILPSISTDTITDFDPSSDSLEILENSKAHVYASGTVSYMKATVDGKPYVANDGILFIDGSTTYTGTVITNAESITGSTGKDSIVGGSGADTITGGTGIDTLTGGEGADTFVFGTDGSIYSPNSPNTAQDSITDFTSGSDLIRFAGAVDKTKGTITGGQVDDYGFATFNSDLNYSAKVSALQASANTNALQTVTLFVDGTDTYVFFSGAAGTGDDQVIKLTGVSGRFFDAITVNGTDITIS
jgi:Ca2+-binding RTX toxin-like protein